MKKYRNKYRVSSARRKGYNYGQNGIYSLTGCTEDMRHFFGEIVDGKFIPSPAGEVVQRMWYEIPNHFPFVELDEFITMPNHIHGILIINKKTAYPSSPQCPANASQFIASPSGTPPSPESDTSPKTPGGVTGPHNPMLQENLARVIRWYKGRCTYEIRKILPEFAWHPRFHDRILRSGGALERTRKYIRENPENWGK